MQHFTSIDQQLKEYIRVKFGATEEILGVSSNSDFFFEMLNEMKAYLRSQIRARQLKKVVMIITSNSVIPITDRELI